jgi:hypothetical protein
MKILSSFVVFVFLTACSNAQVADAVASDTTNMSPNTIRIQAQVISTEKNTAMVKVTEVIAYGSGIINILSAGQEVSIRLQEGVEIAPNEKIQADLREKMGIDASLSTYSVLNLKKINR